jgi:translation initiation factor 2 subunit 2
LKKKKKKKKVTIEEDVPAEQPEEEEEDVTSMFSDLKKKKKKKADDQDDVDDDNVQDDLFDPKDIKDDSQASWHGTTRDYTYPELLSRIFRILRQNNPELAGGEMRRYTIVPPSVHRDGSKKTVFANIVDIARRMNRSPEHIISFLFAELGTTGSVDGEQRLVIKGRFQQKQIENVLRRYIVEYVTCKTCKSPETLLTKENRLYFVQCESCGSTRSVSAIKSGFMAQTAKRAVARRAAM